MSLNEGGSNSEAKQLLEHQLLDLCLTVVEKHYLATIANLVLNS